MSSILVINNGSSSLKFGLYQANRIVLRGIVDRIGNQPGMTLVHGDIETRSFQPRHSDHASVAEALLEWLDNQDRLRTLQGIGYRIVHGGLTIREPVLLNEDTRAYLESLIPLAPLHQPQALAVAGRLQERFPNLFHVACVDTAFHRTQPWVNQQFAIPRHLSDEGILRYGFHGLSYASIAKRLARHLGDTADGRIVVAHLGQGCSLCALLHRQSQATSMGFTALDGLMMGRRCGSLDPGVILYLLQQRGWSADAIERMLYHDSGLYGVSELSDDMRDLEASSNPQAQQAIELFVNRIIQGIGALVAQLGGLDALVFTAGIGEHSSTIRSAICQRLTWLGIELDERANARNDTRLDNGQGPTVLMLPADEEREIAMATQQWVNQAGEHERDRT